MCVVISIIDRLWPTEVAGAAGMAQSLRNPIHSTLSFLVGWWFLGRALIPK